MKKELQITAGNGLPIYALTNNNSHSFFISVFVKSGSMYESEDNNGITHFLEHITIRNINNRMNGKLYSVLDKYGLEFNASTFSEMVQFYISGAKENVNIGIDIISNVLAGINLPKSEIDAERERIRAEIREGDDKSSLAVFTQQVVFDGTSLSNLITGKLGVLSRINQSKLEKYRQRIYTKDNLFAYVTGNVSEKSIEYLSQKLGEYPLYYGDTHSNIAPIPEKFFKREKNIHIKNADFTKVRFTFDMDMTKISVCEADLIYDQLLGGYNSRFFSELSEKRGLCYDLSGSLERYLNIGVFSFSYEIKGKKLYEAIEVTVDTLRRFKDCLMKEDECMKAGYVDNALMLFDDSRELNFTFGYDNHIMNMGYMNLEDRKARYKNITPQDLKRCANELFKKKNLTLTIKGKRKDIDEGKIREILDKL